MSKTAIFIDYDNLYVAIENHYETPQTTSYKTEIVKKIKQLYNGDQIFVFRAFADFEKVTPVLTELQLTELELRHVYSSNAGTINRKNASDIALTIDVMKTLFYKQDIEKFVLVSSDSDMVPLVSELKFNGKDVEVIFCDACTNTNYSSYVQNPHNIETLLNIRQKYQKINEATIQANLRTYLESINNKITDIYNKYNGKGTTSKKDIAELLWNNNNVRANAQIIMEYLFSKNFLYQSPVSSGQTFQKVLINSATLSAAGITLSNAVVTEQNFTRTTPVVQAP